MKEKAVFITGANGGMGSLIVPKLLQQGWEVYAGVASSAANLDAHPRLHVLTMDLTDTASIDAAIDVITQERGSQGLQAVVNLAGIIVEGPVELVPESELRRLYDINVFGPYVIIQKTLPLIRAGKGRIVNVAALSALISAPVYALTASSKAALSFLSDGLRMELVEWKIPVVTVFPGATKTPVFHTAEVAFQRSMKSVPTVKKKLYARMMVDFYANRMKQRENEPEVPVKAILDAIVSPRPRTYYFAGPDARASWVMRAVPVRLRDSLTRRIFGLS